MRTPFNTLLCVMFIGQVAAFRFAGFPFLHRRHETSLLANNKGAPPQTAYTYVEGGDYESRKEEIEAMGGDPFFLSGDDDDDVKTHEKDEPFASSLEAPFGGPDPTLLQEEERYATDGKGPTPQEPPPQKEVLTEDWEWDGIIDEDAHMMDF